MSRWALTIQPTMGRLFRPMPQDSRQRVQLARHLRPIHAEPFLLDDRYRIARDDCPSVQHTYSAGCQDASTRGGERGASQSGPRYWCYGRRPGTRHLRVHAGVSAINIHSGWCTGSGCQWRCRCRCLGRASSGRRRGYRHGQCSGRSKGSRGTIRTVKASVSDARHLGVGRHRQRWDHCMGPCDAHTGTDHGGAYGECAGAGSPSYRGVGRKWECGA